MKNNCENCIYYEPINELRGICQRAAQLQKIEEIHEDSDSPNIERVYSFGLVICFYDFKCDLHRIMPEKKCHHF